MKSETKRRVVRLFGALPDVLMPQVHGDYYSLISHSADELSERAWERTNAQMFKAFKQIEKRTPEIQEKINQKEGWPSELRGFEKAFSRFERKEQEIDEQFGLVTIETGRQGSESRSIDTVG